MHDPVEKGQVGGSGLGKPAEDQHTGDPGRWAGFRPRLSKASRPTSRCLGTVE